MDEARIEQLIDNILYELMTMNTMTALTLVHDPCLSSVERGFVAGVASYVIEGHSEEDGD